MDFLQNIRTARNVFLNQARTGRPAAPPDTVEGQMERGTIWLTPATVKGYRPKDFRHLSSQKQEELKLNVERFLKVAKQVPPAATPTPAQATEAMDAFLAILEALAPYFSGYPEEQRVREALANVTFPDGVLTWDQQFRNDWSGDPGVYVQLYLDDDAVADDGRFRETIFRAREQATEALRAAGVPDWPFISFRTAAEQRAM